MSKRILLASTVIGGLSGLVLAGAPGSVWAQAGVDPSSPSSKPSAAAAPSVGELVVTGSRIRRSTFTTPAPVQVITASDSKAAGLLDVASILQKSSIAAGSVQINSQFGGFVVNGGSGIESVSLRGLGSQRTLVLLNGRRLNPAGVSGTVAAVDLNVIPSALIDRYEILKDGASSIYGSDAVGGVVNIITRDRFDGLTIETDDAFPTRGAGTTYDIAVSGGRVRDNYHVLGSVQYHQRAAINIGDLPGGQCPRELQRAPGQTDFTYGRVNYDGSQYCDFTQTDYVQTFNEGALYVRDPTAPDSFPFTYFAPDPFPTIPRRTNIATDTRERDVNAVVPVKLLSATLMGGFDLPNNREIYFEGLITRRETKVDAYLPSFFPSTDDAIIAASFNPFNPFDDFVQPVLTTPVQKSSAEVTAGRALIGFRGDLGGFPKAGWKFDTYASYGESHATYTEHPRITSRVMNALDVVEAPAGFDSSLVRRNPVNGLNYTCAINIGSPSERCYPLNWFVGSQAFATDPALAYITARDRGRTEYRQVVVSGSMDGPVLDLPAGPLQAVLGAEFRYDKLNDTPGPYAVARDYFGQSTSGITAGDENVSEGYAELEAPLLNGLPLIESLTVNLSGRFTHYRTAGDGWTYKVGANWQVLPALRIRGTYGTSYRGPALFENYLAAQTSFTGATDPCQNYGLENDPGSNIYKNCASEGLAPNFPGYNSTPEVFSQGALGRLKSETSKNLTVGFVFQPTFADLQIGVDYFHIRVNNQVAQLGATNLLPLCYESDAFRNGSPYCSLISARDANDNIQSIDDSYINIASQTTAGFDFNLRYRKEFDFGVFRFEGEATYTTKDAQELIPGTGQTDYNGTFGDPRLVFNTDARFTHGDWTFLWATTFVSKQQIYELVGEDPGGRYKLHQPSQLYHSVSVTYEAAKWKGTLGVKNVFDKYPPVISNNPYSAYGDRVGEFANGYGNLELFGRTIFINLKKDF